MRKRGLKTFLLILTAVVAATGIWGGIRSLQRAYVFWNWSLLPRHAQSISVAGKPMDDLQAFLGFTDLRSLDARGTGMTVQQYVWFREELPECDVLWDIPVQGKYYAQETEQLRVEKLTDAEIESLEYFPRLQLVDVGSWEDYPRIQALKQRYPQCTVRYRVDIAGEWWDSDVVSLLLRDADAGELMEKLARFDRLESVMLTGNVPGLDELGNLQQEYPDIFFLWKFSALGQTLETDMQKLDLTGVPLSSGAELEALLPYFPKLETVILDSTGLPTDDLVAMAVRNPEIRFVFDLEFAGHTLRTDAEEIDISNTNLEDTAYLESLLPCFHDLKKVIMCKCGISDEEMDALNQRYPEIRFVWSVKIHGMYFRTDDVYFTPNRWGLSLTNEDVYKLRYCTDMVCVDIGHNMKVTNCEWVRFMPELKYLVLAETSISDLTPLSGHENLIFLEIFLSKVTDYSPLTTCRALEDLNLCYTAGDPGPIAEMTWLKRLWWSGSWTARTKLAEELPDTYKEFLSLSSTGRGWREGQHYYDMRDFIGMEYMVG